MYKIVVEHVSSPVLKEIRWCLDFPRHEASISLAALETDGLRLEGWVLSNSGEPVELFVRSSDATAQFHRTLNRSDVIRRVLSAQPDAHPQLACGFRVSVPLKQAHAEFGVRFDGQDHVLALISVEGSLKVLEGKDGWLFLDNDTNRSVEQFRGEYLLDSKELDAWRSYLGGFAEIARLKQVRHAVLIAPAKEMVLTEVYPFAKSPLTPLEQLLEVARPEHRLVYPRAAFQDSGERTFRICDTHWTSHGAMLATMEVLRCLGVMDEKVETLFAKDRYAEREQRGDLGTKLYPPRSAIERVLRGFTYRRLKLYDNELPNFGRVMVLANPKAVVGGSCVIFGSSSSYSMLDYLGRVFSRLVFFHSAGNIDVDLLQRERPDFVVAQTNGRFVVRAPVADYELAGVIADKVSCMSEEQRRELAANSESWLGKTADERIMFYHQLLTKALYIA